MLRGVYNPCASGRNADGVLPGCGSVIMPIPPEAAELANEANSVFVDEDYDTALDLYTQVRLLWPFVLGVQSDDASDSHSICARLSLYVGRFGGSIVCRPLRCPRPGPPQEGRLHLGRSLLYAQYS